MLTEWGVGEFPGKGSKAEFIKDALKVVSGRYPRIKAAIFWHERWQNEKGDYSNLHANSSPESLAAYRKGIASPLWLAEPMWKPAAASNAAPAK